MKESKSKKKSTLTIEKLKAKIKALQFELKFEKQRKLQEVRASEGKRLKKLMREITRLKNENEQMKTILSLDHEKVLRREVEKYKYETTAAGLNFQDGTHIL